jgi:hypothetical protein
MLNTEIIKRSKALRVTAGLPKIKGRKFPLSHILFYLLAGEREGDRAGRVPGIELRESRISKCSTI